jgi:hypothetical protein
LDPEESMKEVERGYVECAPAPVVLQRLGDVDQEVARQVRVDDVLLDIDEVIDAGLGLHVLDRLVVHLVPGGRLELHLDAGRLGECGCEHLFDVI